MRDKKAKDQGEKIDKLPPRLTQFLASGACLSLMIGLFASSLVVSRNANRTAFYGSSQRKKTMAFYVELLHETIVWTRLGDEVYHILESDALTVDESDALLMNEYLKLEISIQGIKESMQKLQKKQRRSIRRAPRLRSTNNEFDAFIDAVRMTIELTYTAYSSPRTNTSSSLIGETAHGDSFEIFPNSELEFLRFRLDATLQSYLNAVDDKDKDIKTQDAFQYY
mmetsp:Transcript_21965/g.26425  ORF Transcript_21965/g.26425 Transcript_21965/m.26425 type:complete len:224 (+) Transcript_21965:68-739(+)|eukprot:CAMPEP_0197288702 /NCGR_PEP_ID=MMETSP0890-20130614/5860_1 /TAXON_ID=44058 ORGANISM="Aureoumbra lagunensis, Strain CCMP1510" /NCGR_SAMPLE_ID=MMETSP0890 /ASSEMBLY_ACC=CAM_ASM_000533 /LENGTH=223 /DNA_ID=CAMNT_0042759627 /DNA_START=35 /DNA_END=706 /DNA_ORIENTATION=+